METGYTYLIEQQDKYKIGFTTDLKRRMSQYKTHNSDFKLLYIIKGNQEKELHEKFKEYKVYSEWFDMCNDILSYFKTNGISIFDDKEFIELDRDVFFYTISRMKSLVDIKVFACCLKFAVKREEGNIILTSESSFKKKIKEECNINEQNLCRSLTRLCDSGLLYKNRRAEYIINPQVAYLGNKAERAKLILEIISK